MIKAGYIWHALVAVGFEPISSSRKASMWGNRKSRKLVKLYHPAGRNGTALSKLNYSDSYNYAPKSKYYISSFIDEVSIKAAIPFGELIIKHRRAELAMLNLLSLLWS
jgi:hypothetical protein